MTLRNRLLTVFILLLFPLTAHAELERSNWAWDTRTPDQGHIVANLWMTYETYEFSAYDVDAEYMPATLTFSYGIRDNWSVTASTGYNWARQEGYGIKRSSNGVSDLSVWTTYRLLDEASSGIDLAVMGRLNIPTGDEDRFGSGNFEPSAGVMISKTFGDVFVVSNVGVHKILDSDWGERDFNYSAALECGLYLTDRLNISAYTETGTLRWKSDPNEAYYMVGGGLRFFPTKKTYLSTTVNRYVARDMYNDDWAFMLGAGIEF